MVTKFVNRVLAFILSLLVCVPCFSCTTVIVSASRSVSGRPMIWKQRDAGEEYNHLEYFEGKKYNFTGLVNSRDIERKSVYIGANNVGFAIGNNLSYNIDCTDSHNGEFMKAALGECKTIDDFEHFINDAQQPRAVSANFCVIDANGDAAYFEVGAMEYKRYDVDNGGWLARTNYSYIGTGKDGGGAVRLITSVAYMKSHKGKFSVTDLIDGLGRRFYNALMDVDYTRKGPKLVMDEDFIPRESTVSSIVIEGVRPGDSLDGSVIWCASGYTPASYAMPVWVASKNVIPTSLQEANVLACEIKKNVHISLNYNKVSYVDLGKLRTVIKKVCTAEKKEYRLGNALNERFRAEGFSLELAEAYYDGLCKRFKKFYREMKR